MFKVKDIFDELKLMVEQKYNPTMKQKNILEYCKQYKGIQSVNYIYKYYGKCSRQYFIDVISTRWAVFKESNKYWVDFDEEIGCGTWILEASS